MIPTAEEFYSQNMGVHNEETLIKGVYSTMIEFAKLHVKEALKQASEQVYVSDTVFCEIDRDSILNAYPLNLIK